MIIHFHSSNSTECATLLLVIDQPSQAFALLARPAARWVIIGLHLVLLLVLVLHFEVLVDKEALKYVGCAQEVLEGEYADLTGNYLKYGSYILFLVPFVAIGAPWLAFFAQLALGVLAALAMGKMVRRSSGSKRVGNLSMAVLLLCWPVQFWVLALYTESFFTSMVILFMERVTREGKAGPLVYLLGLITVFARPVGVLFVGPALLWSWTKDLSPVVRRYVRVGGSFAILFFAITIPHIERAQLSPIVEGQVIAGLPEGSPDMAQFTGTTIANAQLYFIRNHSVGETLFLAVRRVFSLYSFHRSWYSILHNVVSSVWYLLYPVALFGLWRGWKEGALRLVALVLLVNTILIGLTHDEWSGRFLVPLVPWVIYLAANAFPRKHVEVGPA
ncbi:MAG: hypothetical protein KBA60_09425 [Flavobacteriales bacterium]|nr:hypothetical protein [Flavobacteriales bacterium]MBP6642718.1 hypothetical protein [Flavobacteriales bacterium]MBP7156218.1 hypothetical protein [Flavobacteriales bacterium]HQV75978.1 hypothetical protein [Flavobacteriales bacterium]HQW39984.1 hypothetical protein [Flavobacteriales bacterium]